MKNETYNGWTNYETWLVNLWITNDESQLEYWRECYQDSIGCSFDFRHARNFAEALKEQFESDAEVISGTSGFWVDLINASLANVNWEEIGIAMRDYFAGEVAA